MDFGRQDYNTRIVDTEDRIPINEPVFFLRGTDALAPALMLEYAKQIRLGGGDPNMARNVEDHAQKMIRYQKTNGCKTPDMVKYSAEKKVIKDKIDSILADRGIQSIGTLMKLVNEYYDTDSDQVKILMSSDLINQDKSITEVMTNFVLDDFKVDPMELTKYKLFIYVKAGLGKFMIIHNSL
jgi:hypothetical protein